MEVLYERIIVRIIVPWLKREIVHEISRFTKYLTDIYCKMLMFWFGKKQANQIEAHPSYCKIS